MIVTIPNCTINNVYADSFTDRKTGEVVEYYRAMVSVASEPPVQLGVTREDYLELQPYMGYTGNVLVNIDARPGQRTRLYLKGVE